MDPWKIFYGLPVQSLDLNCNLFMTFLSFAQNSFYDTNAVERNLSFCHKLVPNASVYNIQAVWGCVHCTTQRVQRWRVNPGTRKQITDGSSTLELQQWSPKVACLCVNVKLFVYIYYITMHCMFVGHIGCRPYSGFSVSFSFSFDFVFLLLLLPTLSDILVCHIADEVRGRWNMVTARWYRRDGEGETEKAR